MFTMTFDPNAIALSIGAGAAAGLVGCFAVMRRMTLAADAISHIALPGSGLAILLRVHPILGGVAALLVGSCCPPPTLNTERQRRESWVDYEAY